MSISRAHHHMLATWGWAPAPRPITTCPPPEDGHPRPAPSPHARHLGTAPYAHAPQAKQVTHYTLLSERPPTFLPEEDPVRALADEIDVGIVAYKAGVEPIAKTNL
jgi:hypothetical protein